MPCCCGCAECICEGTCICSLCLCLKCHYIREKEIHAKNAANSSSAQQVKDTERAIDEDIVKFKGKSSQESSQSGKSQDKSSSSACKQESSVQAQSQTRGRYRAPFKTRKNLMFETDPTNLAPSRAKSSSSTLHNSFQNTSNKRSLEDASPTRISTRKDPSRGESHSLPSSMVFRKDFIQKDTSLTSPSPKGMYRESQKRLPDSSLSVDSTSNTYDASSSIVVPRSTYAQNQEQQYQTEETHSENSPLDPNSIKQQQSQKEEIHSEKSHLDPDSVMKHQSQNQEQQCQSKETHSEKSH